MIFMDNFSLLDTPKTSGVMDMQWLDAKYDILGNGLQSRVVQEGGRNKLLFLDNPSNPLFAVGANVPSTVDTHTVGIRVNAKNPPGGSLTTASMALVAKTGSASVGSLVVFWIRSNWLYVRWKDRNGERVQHDIPLTSPEFYLDITFTKVANANEYSALMVCVNNQTVVYDTQGFCNLGSELMFYFATTLPFSMQEETPFYNEVEFDEAATANSSNLNFSVTDFYITNEGRLGDPIVTHADLVSVTSDLTSSDPLVDVLSGVPDIDKFAAGSGDTLVEFSQEEGSYAQVAALAYPNGTDISEFTITAAGKSATTQINAAPTYVTIDTEDVNVDAKVTI